MIPIDNDAAILTYSFTQKATYKGKDLPPGPYRAASAWVNRDGKWQAFFYQQTPVKEMPKTPPASASPSPGKSDKAAATPAAKPAEAGSDPIANEKLVWDALKSKNYDAFGALLDAASIELETTGVYDKAGSVKAVAEMGPAEFELSEWKAGKLDADATFVTYLVNPKDPKLDVERHSTIWVNRNGKWLALLHIGTPQAKGAAKMKMDMKPDMKKM
jgi:hypothetical protein